MQYISHINVAPFFLRESTELQHFGRKHANSRATEQSVQKRARFPTPTPTSGIERTRHGGKAGSADSYTLYILMWRLAQQASTSKTSVALHATCITIRHSNHGGGEGTGGNNRHNRAQHDAHP